MELMHVSNCLSWLLAVSHRLSGPMELLHASNCLPWLLVVSHCLGGPMEWLHVSYWLPWMMAVTHYLSRCYGFPESLLLSLMVASFLSL